MAKLDYKIRREIAEQLKAAGGEDFLWVLHDYINMGGDAQLKLTIPTALKDWHPTLQQCLMNGFINPAIRVLAKETADDRNRATVRSCAEMVPIIEKYKYPFV